jgi:hypothetical protein
MLVGEIDDGGCNLVARDSRIGYEGIASSIRIQIAATQTDTAHAQERLTGFHRRIGNRLNASVAGFAQDKGFHGLQSPGPEAREEPPSTEFLSMDRILIHRPPRGPYIVEYGSENGSDLTHRLRIRGCLERLKVRADMFGIRHPD